MTSIKSKNKKIEHNAKLVIHGLEKMGFAYMGKVSKWLEKLAKDLRKSAKKQKKTKKSEYSNRFTARLMK